MSSTQWNNYWQELHAESVRRDPRKLPMSWLDAVFGWLGPIFR